MRKLSSALASLAVLALFAAGVWFLSRPGAYGQATPSVPVDPCFSNTPKSSVAVNIVAAATTQLVALSAGKTIYVCGGYLDVASSATAAATAQFQYGTGVNCATGTTNLTGTVGTGTATAGIDAEPFVLPSGGVDFQTAPGNALCLATVGTTVNVQGYIAFIQ